MSPGQFTHKKPEEIQVWGVQSEGEGVGGLPI